MPVSIQMRRYLRLVTECYYFSYNLRYYDYISSYIKGMTFIKRGFGAPCREIEVSEFGVYGISVTLVQMHDPCQNIRLLRMHQLAGGSSWCLTP